MLLLDNESLFNLLLLNQPHLYRNNCKKIRIFFVLNLGRESDSDSEDSMDDSDDEALAAQRAEFAAMFGMSLETMVQSKADEEFWSTLEKYVVAVNKSGLVGGTLTRDFFLGIIILAYMLGSRH